MMLRRGRPIRTISDAELRQIVLELLHWLEEKDLSVRDAIGACGFTLTSLVLLADDPAALAEEIIGIFRRSIKEHFDRHPKTPCGADEGRTDDHRIQTKAPERGSRGGSRNETK